MNDLQKDIFFSLRIPRALFSAVTGAMLGLSGSVYQLVLRNPLADSFTTGAASSSALGAVVAIAIGVPVNLISPFALITGFTGLYAVYKLSSRNGFINPVTMILAGVILNIVASSIIGFTKFYFEDSLSSIVFWLMGGFFMVGYEKLIVASVVLIIAFVLLILRSERLNILALDEYSAATGGINVRKERVTAFFIATVLVAVSVSYTGLIGFVGLIVPHFARSLFGSSMKNNMIFSMILGASLLSLADGVSRTIIPGGTELPVGIITSVIGGVFFLYILSKRRGYVWGD